MMSGIMTDEILTLKEVADYLKLAEKTAYRLAAEGKLPGFKVGGSWRFKREDVQSWIEQQKIDVNQSKRKGDFH
jgi:excisionase family DNA binding protein